MSLHLSKAKAAKLALKLAHKFLSAQDSLGWEWELSSAEPDAIEPCRKGRKIPTKWTVGVQYSRSGSPLDGPAILLIDIADGTVSFFDSPE